MQAWLARVRYVQPEGQEEQHQGHSRSMEIPRTCSRDHRMMKCSRDRRSRLQITASALPALRRLAEQSESQVASSALSAPFNSLKPGFCVSIHKTPRVTPGSLHSDGAKKEL
jgi:hypothetical protein